MGLRQRRWAHKARKRLLKLLGDRCNECHSEENLELDCIIPLGDAHHKMEFSWRTSFYRRQWKQGNLQLLCQTCNAKKDKNQPF